MTTALKRPRDRRQPAGREPGATGRDFSRGNALPPNRQKARHAISGLYEPELAKRNKLPLMRAWEHDPKNEVAALRVTTYAGCRRTPVSLNIRDRLLVTMFFASIAI